MEKQAITVEGDYIERLDADDPDLNAAFFKFVDALDQEATSGGSIAVYEVPVDAQGLARAKTLRKTKLFTTPIGASTLDDICDRVVKEFMSPGQTMTIQLLGTHDGRAGIRLNRLINLRKSNVDAKEIEAGGIAGVLKMMQEENARARADMMRLVSSMNQTPQVNPLELGMTLFQRMTDMMKALQPPAPVAPAPSIPGVAPGSPMDQMLQMMTVMTAMRKFFGEDKAKEASTAPSESLGSILQSVRDIAVPLIAASNRQAAMAPRISAPLPSHTGDPAKVEPISNHTGEPPKAEPIPNATQNPKEAAEMKLLTELGELLPMLIDMAKKSAPAKDVASMILQAMPNNAEYNDALYAFVRDDECVNRLALMNADVEPLRAWFDELRREIAAEFEPDEPAPTEESAS